VVPQVTYENIIKNNMLRSQTIWRPTVCRKLGGAVGGVQALTTLSRGA